MARARTTDYTGIMSGIPGLYSVGIALCLFSSGVVSAKTTRTGQPLFYFSLYLGLEAVCFLFELLIAHPIIPLKALWLGLLMATSFLIAPCLWFAIKESVDGVCPTLRSIDWKQRAVILAGAILTLPLIETAHFGARFVADQPARTLLEPVIHETMLLCLALFAVQVPFYLWRCRRLLLNNSEVETESPGWLQIPLIIVGTTWLLGVLRTVIGAFSAGSAGFFAWVALVDVSVTIGAAFLIMRRLIARRVAAQPAHNQAKYAKSPLDSAVRARIVRKLEVAVAEEMLYRDAGLSLSSLSRHINESEHYVSQVINQELNASFYEYVNVHRIEHAKRLLIESLDQNVLDVALSVGFNAKSTFNSAFRRHTGTTPREFRAQANAQSGRIAPIND